MLDGDVCINWISEGISINMIQNIVIVLILKIRIYALYSGTSYLYTTLHNMMLKYFMFEKEVAFSPSLLQSPQFV